MAVETAVAKHSGDAQTLEKVVIGGDLSELSPAQRVTYYRNVCDSIKLNPFTKPFEYIKLNGKLTLYARKDATDQLRQLHGVSIARLERDRHEDVYVVTAYARTKDGREDSAIGAVTTASLRGEALANAMMKAETKAKRRVTLSICGLGWTDETEIDSIPAAQSVQVDTETGEIKDEPAKATEASSSKKEEQAWDLWAELWNNAKAFGLEVESLPKNTPYDALVAAGKSLRGRIEAEEAKRTSQAELPS